MESLTSKCKNKLITTHRILLEVILLIIMAVILITTIIIMNYILGQKIMTTSMIILKFGLLMIMTVLLTMVALHMIEFLKNAGKHDQTAAHILASFRKRRTMKTRRWYRQLKVVLWKNSIIRKRHWLLAIFEALIPVSLFLLIAYGRSKITGLNKTEITDVTYSQKFPVRYDSTGINLEETLLYYSPANDFFADLIHRVQVKFQLTNNNVQGFNNPDSLLEQYAKSNNFSVIAIIFNSAKNSPQLDYTIRSHGQSWDNTQELYKSSFTFEPGVGSDYYWRGFLALQKALDMSFIQKINGTEIDIDIETLEFPYPPYKSDSGMSDIFIHYLPLITLFSFIFVCPALLKRVVEEKYSGIKELMKMVGMRPWMLWLGWFIYSMIPMVFSVCLVVLVMKLDLFGVSYPLIEYADTSVLIVFLILYCMAATVACFFISTLFNKPTLATLVGLLVWILMYFVPKYLLEGQNNVPLSWSYTLLLLPNLALHYGYTAVSYYEEREIGVNWSNINIPGGGGSNEVTMSKVLLMLIFDIFFYMVLTLYFDSIIPGKYGVPKSVFSPFKGKWTKSLKRWYRRKTSVEVKNKSENMKLKDVDVETGRGLGKGIELFELTKKYGKKEVVRRLTMDIYKDCITVLLGHNGAGKTTTMGMITGMISKTAGTIRMDGREIESSSDITSSIGLCPQHNLFFPDLTVKEHLQFFAMLKGKTLEDSNEEIATLLKKLDLLPKANEMAHTLSGGMKRKLCLGMAVVGGSKILILDEPSSGMDPESRRHMWDLLLSWRNDRTILISTHFMEEADALGDWIAIMKEGTLENHGTPMKLKKEYETGYNLNLHIDEAVNVEDAVKKIEAAISEYKPVIKSINKNDVVFLLPFGGNYIKMFQFLEEYEEKFNIVNMSCTTTTMEDVFLNANGKNRSDRTMKNQSDCTIKVQSDSTNDVSSMRGSQTGYDYKLTFKALFVKRYRFIYWKLQTYLIPCIISLLFLLLCIYLGQGANGFVSKGGPALKMKLDSYGKTTVMFNGSNDPTILKIKDFYGKMVTNETSDFRVVGDVSEEIVKEGIDNLPYYKYHMVAAAEFTRNSHGLEAVAMYNNLAGHSAPISLNLITNTFAKAVLGEQYSISMTNHPLDNINSDTAKQLSEVQIGLLWLIIMPMGFLFFLGSFIYFPYVELSTNFTQLQFMCGCPPWLYWMITYLSDFMFYVCFALFMCVISLAWTPFRGGYEFEALFSILVMYGVCGIPYAYLFGRRRSFSGAYALFIILGIMLGVVLTGIVSVLEESGDDHFMHVGDTLRILFLLFCPQFGLTYSGFKFSKKVIKNYNFKHMLKMKLLSECHREEPNPCCFGDGPACVAHQSYWNVLNPCPNFVLMAVGAAIFLLISILFHTYWIRECINKVNQFRFNKKHVGPQTKDYTNDPNTNNFDETDDGKTNTLKVKKLQKSYSQREVVKNIDFTLKRGQCMGILGVNGAGKTTIFKMLTRAEVKDNGFIKINEFDINQEQYLRKLGYCPQNDALNYSLTGREILQTMAWLRGIHNPLVVGEFLKAFELTDLADIPCEYYSGGNKRKLSFAVAVIGIPDVILLDEPTNGVDPSSKRTFWNLIKNIKNTCNNSFVLTSHSMTECEALCNDLKIIRGGKIMRNGTIAQLRDQLNGFDVKMRLKQFATGKPADKEATDKKPAVKNTTDNEPQRPCDETDGDSISSERINSIEEVLEPVDALKRTVLTEYPQAELKDEHPGLLHYYIKTPKGVKKKKWSHLFERFEHIKEQYSKLIEEYSISEASLEDVFLDVARTTENEDQNNPTKP